MKFSVVVPVYNVQDYIADCIQSLLSQSFSDFEVILVDDGSSDKSGNLCDEFAKADTRVRVLHKQNGGLSDARNSGISECKGDYISFLDGDDVYYENALQNAYDAIEKYGCPDVVAGRMKTFGSDTRGITDNISLPYSQIDRNELILTYFQAPFVFSACRFFVKKSLFEHGDLFFEKGLLHEDEEWTPRLLTRAQSFAFFDPEFYGYRMREGSITAKVSYLKPKSKLIICKKLIEYRNGFEKDSPEYLLLQNRITLLADSVFSTLMLYQKREVALLRDTAIEAFGNKLGEFSGKGRLYTLIRLFGIKTGVNIFMRFKGGR